MKKSEKLKTLRKQFNNLKSRLKNKIIEEEALDLLITGGSLDTYTEYGFFKRLNFEEIYKKGITRKNRLGATVRYKGIKAINLQINSLKKRISKNTQKDLFTLNYLKSLRNVGVNSYQISIIRNLLKSKNYNDLTYLIKRGILPQIAYNYAQDNTEYLISTIKKALNFEINFDTSKLKELTKNVKEQKKLLNL